MGTVYRRNERHDILNELAKERTARLQLKGQLGEMTEQVAKLCAAIDTLRQEVAKRDNEIVRLKTQINKDCTNPSKPPSRNGFKKIHDNREKRGKKQGGQEGHKGETLAIPSNLEEPISIGKVEHNVIRKVAEGESFVSDWLIDVKIITVYTEIHWAVGAPLKIR